jgi:hypothetical protein
MPNPTRLLHSVDLTRLKTLLLHNPTAGASHPTPDDLMKAAKKAGFIPTYQSIKAGDYKTTLGDNWDLVLVAEGDGTITILHLHVRQSLLVEFQREPLDAGPTHVVALCVCICRR